MSFLVREPGIRFKLIPSAAVHVPHLLSTFDPCSGSPLAAASPLGFFTALRRVRPDDTRWLVYRASRPRMGAAGVQMKEKIMTQLITPAELEDLNEFELRSKFCRISNDLVKAERAAAEVPMQKASLENVERSLQRKLARKRSVGPQSEG